MKCFCPSCKQTYDADASYIGQLVDCPACGTTIECRSFIKRAPTKPLPPENPDKKHDMLCVVLGMVFPLLGPLAGAIIAHGRGLLMGFLGNIILGMIYAIGAVLWHITSASSY